MEQVLEQAAGTKTGRMLEADDKGMLRVPTEMLGAAQPHGRYLVEVVGKKLSIEPEEAAVQRRKTYEQWKREWDTLTEEITAAWNTDKSAAEIISEMRR